MSKKLETISRLLFIVVVACLAGFMSKQLSNPFFGVYFLLALIAGEVLQIRINGEKDE